MKSENKGANNYSLKLAPAYKSAKGYWSINIGAAEFDALQKIKLGGRLSLTVVNEESRTKETSPHAYFNYLTPEQVSAYTEKGRAKAASKNKAFGTKSGDSDY